MTRGPDLVKSEFLIPDNELAVRTTRSSGAGGQHVNKTASRVQLSWNVRQSVALDNDQRARLLRKLASRISSDGMLTVAASDTRSQHRNREIAQLRLTEIVRRALLVPKRRRATRPSGASREARLETKRLHSLKKRQRRTDSDD